MSAAATSELLVACLCARWCQLCNSYRATFEAAAARHPGHRFVYVDIEDEADLMHAIDVDNFPTLLVAQGERLQFLGVITPQPDTLERLLRAAEDRNLPPAAHALDEAELGELLLGLRQLA
ncbi:thioredoxin family protein [Ideonella sp. BN130291]|uniref:thioredoxin family protein n=1 Tax=Ideonella sp. BN130291 TaxID=3112940 RepID=UPI002E2574B4|nr:thioredoxin family protein [Ideonella sp. BN130291]